MNRTTAWRYLQALASTGLISEVGEGRFALGARILSLAEAYSSQWAELEAVAGIALVRLRDHVGETAGLHLRQGWTRVVVRQVESHHELHRTYRELGQPISLLVGAPSRAILAGMERAERAAYLGAEIDGACEDVDVRRLEDELSAIRAAGYAHTRGARVPDVASVAAAIRNPDGQVLGAVNVTGPAHRLPEASVAKVAREVLAAARWIEVQLAGARSARGRHSRDS
jgi:DNA-binding IclR family transcriptional regulator